MVSLSLLVATIVELELRNIEYSLLSTILFSKVWSFFEWMLYTAPYFSYRYPLDKKSFYRQHQADLKAAENVPARQTAKQKTQNKSKSSKVRSVPERKV